MRSILSWLNRELCALASDRLCHSPFLMAEQTRSLRERALISRSTSIRS